MIYQKPKLLIIFETCCITELLNYVNANEIGFVYMLILKWFLNQE